MQSQDKKQSLQSKCNVKIIQKILQRRLDKKNKEYWEKDFLKKDFIPSK